MKLRELLRTLSAHDAQTHSPQSVGYASQYLECSGRSVPCPSIKFKQKSFSEQVPCLIFIQIS